MDVVLKLLQFHFSIHLFFVSILVLMDVVLKPSLTVTRNGRLKVSILVLMDVVLKPY